MCQENEADRIEDCPKYGHFVNSGEKLKNC
jgi:hypothetical protein